MFLVFLLALALSLRVWAFDKDWALAKFSDQGDKLQVQDCHDEVALLRAHLKVLDDMRERTVSGCLTLNAGAFKRDLYPRVEEKLKALAKFTEDTERELLDLK